MCGDGFVGVDSLVAHGDADIAVPGDDLGDVRRQSVEETGSERFTCCAEWVPRAVVCWGYSSCLVIAGFGEFGGVAGPVASGLSHPFDRCGRCEAEEVGEYGGG